MLAGFMVPATVGAVADARLKSEWPAVTVLAAARDITTAQFRKTFSRQAKGERPDRAAKVEKMRLRGRDRIALAFACIHRPAV